MTVSSGLDSVQGRAYYVTDIVFCVLSIVAVALRVWAAQIRRRRYEWHDWFMFGALVCAVGFTVDNLISIDPGAVGLHIQTAEQDLGMGPIIITEKAFFASVFLWTSATALAKLSVLALLVSIFAKPLFRYGAYAIGILTIMFWIAYIVAECLICTPINYNWDKTIDGHCGNLESQEIAVAVINLVLDFSIVLLPMPIIYYLQMPLKRKLLIAGILSLGLAINVINITRIVLVVQTGASTDFTYDTVNVGLLSAMEIYLGIINGCLPVLGPLVFKDPQKSSLSLTPDYYGDMTTATKKVSMHTNFSRKKEPMEMSNLENERWARLGNGKNRRIPEDDDEDADLREMLAYPSRGYEARNGQGTSQGGHSHSTSTASDNNV